MHPFVAAFIKYHKGALLLPWYWRIWGMLLFAANIVAPLIFIQRFEGQVVIAVSLVNALLFTILTRYTGFSRLLSLAHILWPPMIVYLFTRLDAVPADSAASVWLRILLVLNSLSVLIDITNVYRYCAGERAEMVSGLTAIDK